MMLPRVCDVGGAWVSQVVDLTGRVLWESKPTSFLATSPEARDLARQFAEGVARTRWRKMRDETRRRFGGLGAEPPEEASSTPRAAEDATAPYSPDAAEESSTIEANVRGRILRGEIRISVRDDRSTWHVALYAPRHGGRPTTAHGVEPTPARALGAAHAMWQALARSVVGGFDA